MLKLRPELASDSSIVERLLDLSFGADRTRRISYRYRTGIEPVRALCAVAQAAGLFVGAIRYWPVCLDRQPALLLGPVAIDPGLRNQGIGRLLIDATLMRARDMGWKTVFLVGDIDYYSRFAFTTAPATIVMPGEAPARLQWRLLGSQEPPREARGTILRASPGMVSSCGLPRTRSAMPLDGDLRGSARCPIAQSERIAYQDDGPGRSSAW